MSFFSVSQNESMFSSNNFLQRQDKMSYRTAEPYTRPSQNNIVSYNHQRVYSPVKINPTLFLKNALPTHDGMSECNQMANPNQPSLRQNFSSSSMFPSHKAFMFNQNAKPSNSNASFMYQKTNESFIPAKEKKDNTAVNEQTYEDAKMKLTEYLGNEFNSFKNEIHKMDLLKENDYENVLKKIEENLSQSLQPYCNLVKTSTAEIEKEIKSLSFLIKSNNKHIHEKYKRFNKIFDDALLAIENNINKNKDKFKDIELSIEKLSKNSLNVVEPITENNEESQEKTPATKTIKKKRKK